MTTGVMIGNIGGSTPGLGVYQQQLDENGEPIGEMTPWSELPMGQFSNSFCVHAGMRLVIVETPQPAPAAATDAAPATPADPTQAAATGTAA